MIVLDDLCGDEDDTVIEVEYLKQCLQNRIYEALSKIEPITYEQSIKIVEGQYRKVLMDAYTNPEYDPQVKCTLEEDGKMNVTFLCPQWLADRINEND